MTIKQLHEKLQELNISPERYFLHGLYGSTDDNDKLSMTIRRGKYTFEYEVYSRERGEKHSIIVFTDEDKACDYFMKKILELDKFERDIINNAC
jgi:hypothetical protein